jgi:hypothetical protein
MYIIVIFVKCNIMDTIILEKPDYKTIRVSTKNYEKLVTYGKYSDSMDTIIGNILCQLSNPDFKKTEVKK